MSHSIGGFARTIEPNTGHTHTHEITTRTNIIHIGIQINLKPCLYWRAHRKKSSRMSVYTRNPHTAKESALGW